MNNQEQFDYWNGDAGKRWAQEDDTMARLLEPVCQALLSHARLESCRNALDIGCGGGSQSLLLAQRLGPGAQVLGVDISAPMLEVAQRKASAVRDGAAQLSFLQADAAHHNFEAGSFDLLFSRFGVMFFDDPTGAFRNLRTALKTGGQLAFCCWQAMRDNDWTRIPVQAALQHLSAPETPDPHAPGPFAFADASRLESILADAGFQDIAIQSQTTDIRFGESPSLAESVRELAMIGPVSRLITGQEPDVLERVFKSMEEALAPYYRDGTIQMTGAVWFVTGSAG